MAKNNLTKSENRYGFTLVEIAIVLAIAGLIFAAIWVVASNVSNNQKISQTIQEVGQTAQNIRQYYMGAGGIPSASACDSDVTATIDGNGLIPPEMRSSCPSCNGDNFKIDHIFTNLGAYGTGIGEGSYRITTANCTGTTASHFRIVLLNLPQQACIDLAMTGMSYKDHSLGITNFCLYGGATGTVNTCYNSNINWKAVSCSNGICDVSPSITLASAVTTCSKNFTQIGWEFNVRD